MSNRRNRIVFGSALLIGVLAVLWIDHHLETAWGFVALTLYLSIAGLREYYAFARSAGSRPFCGLGFAMAAALVIAQACCPSSVHWLLCLFVLTTFAAQGLVRGPGGSMRGIADTLFGVFYVPFLATFLLDIRHIPESGEALTLMIVLSAKAGDMGAYFGGKALGRHKLAPVISPNKTVEGSVCGLLATVGFGVAFSRFTGALTPARALALSSVVGISAQLGDLGESLLKRDVNADDAGHLLPGLGGALDVIDSLLVCGPAAWFCIHLCNWASR